MDQYQEGMTATGPGGAKMVFRGGAWVPAGGSAPSAPPAFIAGPPKAPDVTSPAEAERLRYAANADARAAADQARQNTIAPLEIVSKQLDVADKTQKQADEAKGLTATEGERKSAVLATRLIGSLGDINTALSGSPGEKRPLGTAEIAGIFGSTARNYANTPARRQIENAQLDALDAALTLATGAAYTKEQLEGYRQSNFPQLGDDDATIAAKQLRFRRLIESARIAAGKASPQIDQALAAVGGEQMDRSTAITDIAEPGRGVAVPTVGKQQFSTPEDEKFAGLVQAAFDNGASRADIDALSAKYGIPAYGPDLDAALQYRDKGGKGAQIAAAKSGSTNPNVVEDTVSSLAASPVGGLITGSLNGLTAGGLDEAAGLIQSAVSGRPTDEAIAEADFKKRLISNESPVASAIGNIGGAVGATMVGEAGLARLGLSAISPAVRIAGETAYGAGYGALEDNQDRVSGAVKGALAGTAGGVAGRAIGKGIAGAVGPTGGKSKILYENGVRPTPGQRAGGVANWTEETLGSLPFVGGTFRGARQQARDQFERGAFDQALGDIGTALPAKMPLGTAPHAFAQKAFDAAYDEARAGMRLLPDQQFGAELGQIQRDIYGGGLDGEGIKRFERIVREKVGRRFQNGAMDGGAYKAAQADIGKITRNLRNSPSGDQELAGVLEDFSLLLDGAARRASPVDAVAKLDAADAGYAKLVRIEDAARRAGPSGRFTPAQFDRAVQNMAGGKGTRSKAYLRGDALMQDYADAGRSLMDTVPNSGTPERGMTLGLLAGNVAVSPLAAASALPALAYAPGVRNVTAGVLAPRNTPTANALADWLRVQNPRIGAAGAGGALALSNR